MTNKFTPGQLMAKKVLFGEHKRFAIAPVFTREGVAEYFVWDAELQDPVTKSASVIRQEPTIEQALVGFEQDVIAFAKLRLACS